MQSNQYFKYIQFYTMAILSISIIYKLIQNFIILILLFLLNIFLLNLLSNQFLISVN